MTTYPAINRAHPLNRGRALWLRADRGVSGPSWRDVVRGQEATLTGAAGGAGQGIVSGYRDGGRPLLSNNATLGSGADLTALSPIPYAQDSFTVAVWVYFRSLATSRQSVMLRGGASGGQMGILINGPSPGSSIWRFQNGTGTVNSGLLSPLTWYRLLVSVSPSAVRMFRNGELETVGSPQLPGSYPGLTTFTVGYDPGSNRTVDGFIDSISVWDYALPDALARDDYLDELTGCRATLRLRERRGWSPAAAYAGAAPPAAAKIPWHLLLRRAV